MTPSQDGPRLAWLKTMKRGSKVFYTDFRGTYESKVVKRSDDSIVVSLRDGSVRMVFADDGATYHENGSLREFISQPYDGSIDWVEPS